MDDRRPNHRTDEQLWAILDETGEWTVSDRRGRRLYAAASLRDAVREAMVYAAASKHAVEIYHQSDDNVVVSRRQLESIANMIGSGF